MHTWKTELGSGLIWIWRPWWVHQTNVIPTEQEAIKFLEYAIKSGIRFFDTAPSYGLSEQRLWFFLKQISNEVRKTLFVATKCGELWNPDGTTIVDHTYEEMKKSIENSMALLWGIDLLQIHKTNPQILVSEEILKINEYRKSVGIPYFWVSISDVLSWQLACEIADISYIQLPFNQENIQFASVIQLAKEKWKKILVNRPFGMGGLVPEWRTHIEYQQRFRELFQFIIDTVSPDIILTGTKSIDHLGKNIDAFS